jgi:hypothetical protein
MTSNEWRKRHGLAPVHPPNHEYPRVPILPPPPVKVNEALSPEIREQWQRAWQVWANTLFLSGGDRAAADRAFQAALNQEKEG